MGDMIRGTNTDFGSCLDRVGFAFPSPAAEQADLMVDDELAKRR